jgi:hypothetical protein
MKNQNDLIISISVLVVGLIVAVVIYATAPQPTKPAEPTAVDVSPPKLPAGDVVYNMGSGAGGGGFGGMGGGMGGRPGGRMGGPMGRPPMGMGGGGMGGPGGGMGGPGGGRPPAGLGMGDK